MTTNARDAFLQPINSYCLARIVTFTQVTRPLLEKFLNTLPFASNWHLHEGLFAYVHALESFRKFQGTVTPACSAWCVTRQHWTDVKLVKRRRNYSSGRRTQRCWITAYCSTCRFFPRSFKRVSLIAESLFMVDNARRRRRRLRGLAEYVVASLLESRRTPGPSFLCLTTRGCALVLRGVQEVSSRLAFNDDNNWVAMCVIIGILLLSLLLLLCIFFFSSFSLRNKRVWSDIN